jgi:hypothetical protein
VVLPYSFSLFGMMMMMVVVNSSDDDDEHVIGFGM